MPDGLVPDPAPVTGEEIDAMEGKMFNAPIPEGVHAVMHMSRRGKKLLAKALGRTLEEVEKVFRAQREPDDE